MKKTALLLINLGSIGQLTTQGIRQFYRAFLSDQRVVNLPKWVWLPILYGFILPFRPRKTIAAYKQIWRPDGSPLISLTRSLATKLREHLLSEYNQPVEVMTAMCYGESTIAMAIKELQQKNCSNIVVLPLYPQYNASTTAAAFDKVSDALKKSRFIPEVHFINHYATEPAYINAIAKRIRSHWDNVGKPSLLLFSFHGVPKKLIHNGDPYLDHCRQTAKLVADQLLLANHEWRLVFQSRFGKTPWLEPYIDITVSQLPSQGHKIVDVVCPGFAVDCLETLYEINIENSQRFREAGGEELRYIPALNDRYEHYDMLASLYLKITTHHETKQEVNYVE